MSDTNQAETFTERVDVTTQPDGAFIGTMERSTSWKHPRHGPPGGAQRPAGPDRGARTREHGATLKNVTKGRLVLPKQPPDPSSGHLADDASSDALSNRALLHRAYVAHQAGERVQESSDRGHDAMNPITTPKSTPNTTASPFITLPPPFVLSRS